MPLCVWWRLWISWALSVCGAAWVVALLRSCRTLAVPAVRAGTPRQRPRPPGGAASVPAPARGRRSPRGAPQAGRAGNKGRAPQLLAVPEGLSTAGSSPQAERSGQVRVTALLFAFTVPSSTSDLFCNSNLGRQTLNEIWCWERSVRLCFQFSAQTWVLWNGVC